MSTKTKIKSDFEVGQTVYFAIHRLGGWIIYAGKILLISPAKIRNEKNEVLETNELVLELTTENVVKRYETNVWTDKNKLHRELMKASGEPIKWSF